jgi:hypothetical protein
MRKTGCFVHESRLEQSPNHHSFGCRHGRDLLSSCTFLAFRAAWRRHSPYPKCPRLTGLLLNRRGFANFAMPGIADCFKIHAHLN